MGAPSELVETQSRNNVQLMDDDIKQLLFEAEQRLRQGKVETNGELVPPTELVHTLPNIPKLSSGSSLKPYVRQRDDLAVIDTTRLPGRDLNNGTQPQPTERKVSKSSSKDKPTAGSDWFDLPATELTPELKRDLQLLRMRSILDPKRHYKKEGGKAQLPQYSQVGTVIEGPTEFFSGRIIKRDRKKTFVEEAMVLERETNRFETRYNDVQDKKRSGKKGFYQNLRAKRQGGKNRP
ncbi:Fcf2 pre-rRNA processing-domain-containing protein [Aspergillus californicus]